MAKPASKKRNVVAEARSGGKTKSSQPAGKWLWENFKSLAGAVVIYLFVKTLAYGPTIPFTNTHLPGYTSPKHQDVVVFESPYQPDNAPDFTPTLVKRLIGM